MSTAEFLPNEIKELLKQQEGYGPYVLGKVDPVLGLKGQYTFFGGTDIRVLINGIVEGTIQEISFKRENIDQIQETILVDIISLCLTQVNKLPDNIKSLVLVAANEYGNSCIVYGFENLRKCTHSLGISVNDMVVEETYVYKASKYVDGVVLRTTGDSQCDKELLGDCKSLNDLVSHALETYNHDCQAAFAHVAAVFKSK